MNVYEAIVIIDTEKVSQVKNFLYDIFKSGIKENAIKVIKIEEFGNRKLAYPIRNKKSGYYISFTFLCSRINILDINLNELQGKRYILKYIIMQNNDLTQTNTATIIDGLPLVENLKSNVENNINMEELKNMESVYKCYECEKEVKEEEFYNHVWAKIDDNYPERLTCIAEYVCKECLEKILQEKNLTMSDIYDYEEEEIISFIWHEEKFYYYERCDAHYDDFYECEQCGEWINREIDNDIVETEDCIFCSSDCAEDYGYRQCYHCSDWVYENDSYYTHDGNLICEDCYNNHYTTCNECGEIYNIDDMCYDEEEDVDVCYNCYNEATTRAELVKNYHYYKSSYWQPRFYNNTSNDNLFGVELEVENKKQLITNNETVKKICEIDKDEVFVFESDGSLNNGFEIISNPCSLNYWYSKENELKEIFEKLSNSGFSSHDTTTCGLHIHFSRDYVDTEIIGRILYLFEKFKNHLVMFSRRKIDNLNRWASFMNVDFKELSLDYVKSNQDNCNRYKAVNLTNNKTIEIRIFKGTLKFESFMACIELVNNIVEMAKNMNDNEIINVESFYNVIEYRKTKYLKQYCLERRIVENVNNIECEG